VLPDYFQVAPSRMHNFSLVYNAVISPRFVIQTLAGVNYFKQVFGDANTGFDPVALGLNTGVTNPSLSGAPFINIGGIAGSGLAGSGSGGGGFAQTGLTPPLGRIDTTGHVNETLTYTMGSHQFRFGAEYRRSRLDVFYQRNTRGRFTFNGTQGPFQDPASVALGDTWHVGGDPSIGGSLNALADFLAGRVAINNAHITYGDLQRDYYLNGVTTFFQDTWKATPSFTLNYGLNWMYQSPAYDYTNRISTFIAEQGGITYQNQLGSLWPRDYNDFGPRFGFAYQPKFNSKLVVRGGYGIFYQVPNVNYFGDNRPPNGGATGILANPFGLSPVYTLSNQAPLTIQAGVPVFGNADFPTGPFGAFSVSRHFVTGYVQNTNFNIQYQLSHSSVLELGYIGSLSRHLPATLDINQIPIGAPEENSSRPYFSQFPDLATINEIQSVANGYYNGLIASLRTSSYHGFSMKLNYTYGHSRDDQSATRNSIPQNSYCLRCDYGNSDYDIRHSFAGFISYALPTPSRFRLLLGGWQVNSLLTFYTGQPFTVFTGEDTSLTGENNDRAEVVGDPFKNVPPDSKPNYASWFNPTAFVLPLPGTYANQSRNAFYGPPTYQVDFSVFKNTNITERLSAQLRLEMFNVFNTRDLATVPNNALSGSGLGQITSTLGIYNGAPGIGTGEPRNIQLGLKLIF
jgi:hypothetical protein